MTLGVKSVIFVIWTKNHQFDLVICKVSCRMTKWWIFVKFCEILFCTRRNQFCEIYFPLGKSFSHILILMARMGHFTPKMGSPARPKTASSTSFNANGEDGTFQRAEIAKKCKFCLQT